MAQVTSSESNKSLVDKLQVALTSLEQQKNSPVLKNQDVLNNFIIEIKKWVNKIPEVKRIPDSLEHREALVFALKACEILDELLQKQPDQGELRNIINKLRELETETPLECLGRICLGIVAALLIIVVLILEMVLTFMTIPGGDLYRDYYGTKVCAIAVGSIFCVPVHPAVQMIYDLCDDAQQVINQEAEEKNQKLLEELKLKI